MPVIKTVDGTYRRFIGKAYARRFVEFENWSTVHRVFGVHESIAQEFLDVAVEQFKLGGNYPIIYEERAMTHLLDDDIPLFLWTLFEQWRRGVYPFLGYVHSAEPFSGYILSGYKGGTPNAGYTAMEGALPERARHMLVFEMGDSLWLAKATPRPCLEQARRSA